MNDGQEVSLKFKNSVTGLSKLEQYEQRLTNLKKTIDSFPKNFSLGGVDYTKQLETTNKLLINLNRNMSSFKRSTTSTLGNMKKPINETNKALQNVTKNMKPANNELDTFGKKLNLAFNYTTLRTFVRGLKQVTKSMAELITKASDYGEDINLFQVAFDYTYNDAERFVNKMTEMYGLDEDWLTRTTGIFKQLSNAMQLSTEQGTKLSKIMTQMSLDISSLYNLDVERGSSVLQSALAGQTKPIRGATGADITQATLQQTLSEIGIDKSISDLSYAEKRLVIIVSLTRQLQASVGDMAKTIEQPANQTRILNEQWERLTRAVGNLFLPVIKKVLPYLNAVLMVLTEIINIIASLFGYDISDFDAVAGVADSVLELEDGLNGASESAEKLKRGLRSFDKLNNITTPTASTSNVGGGTGGIDPAIWKAFNSAYDDYFKQLSDVEMKATQIRDRIMEWLGFTKEVNEETGKVSFKFDHITFGSIASILVSGLLIIGGLKKIFGIIGGIGKFLGVGGSATASAGASGGILGTLGIIGLVIVGLVTFLKNLDTELKKMSTYDYTPTWVEQFLLFGESDITKKVAKLVEIFQPIVREGVVFDASISPETEKKVKSFYENILALNKEFVNFDLTNKIISDDDIETINDRLKKITEAIYNELDADKNTTLEEINLTKSMMNEEDYNNILKKVDNYYSERKTKVESAEKRINEIVSNASKENRSLTEDEYKEITNLRNEILDTGLEAMSETDEEYAKLRIRINQNINANALQQAGEYLKLAKDTKDKAIKEAEEQYEGIVLEAEKLKNANAITDEEYNAIVESARLTKEKTIKEAEEQYDGIVNTTKEKLGENAKYIDENTGKIKSKFELWFEDLKKVFNEKTQEIKTWWNDNVSKYFTKDYWEETLGNVKTGLSDGISKIKDKIVEKWNEIKTWWNNNVAKYFTKDYWQEKFDFSNVHVKTPHISWKEGGTQATGTIKTILEALSLPTSLPKLNVEWYANGGLPPVGQLFVANERGAELVGNIGGQSFVANQNQVVDLLDRKLANANTGIQNATFVVQVGDEKIGKVVLNDLQKMAKSNGKVFNIGV